MLNSVVIVSQSRIAGLMRCLDGLKQLNTPGFEVIVVADQPSITAVLARSDGARIKCQVFDDLNISAARNKGIQAASGKIVAFIDDDAVPEPTWLDALIAPFQQDAVTATGGFVLGRNGVSLQWGASQADAAGRSFPCAPDDPLGGGRVWRTEGTCMAVRRASLIAVGGFDEAFRFFLDETDLNRRLPGKTVICPDAVVHHGFFPSQRRRQDRVPKDLSQIGASVAVFLRKHSPTDAEQRLGEIRLEQRRRLLQHMVAGRLDPGEVWRLMAGLEDGVRDGAIRPSAYAQFDWEAPFLPFQTSPPGPLRLLSGSVRMKDRLMREAAELVEHGFRPTVFTFDNSPRRLRISFESPGIWHHSGGIWGRVERDKPRPRPTSLNHRIDAERRRITKLRGRFVHPSV